MTDHPQPGMLIAGRYELIEPVGAGGVGRVFAARDRRLERRVAIKLIEASQARSTDPATTERFVVEARSGATFTHPHAVTVFDAGATTEYLYLVTELVEGTTLAARIADGGPLDVDEAIDVTDQILQALGAAHQAGIIHRDVKPSNVLLDRDGAVKLADFGIAKRLDQVQASLTSTGHFVGTAGYAAPEQAAGEAATPATDIYAVGVTLHEMLAGTPPYRGDTPIAVALAHRESPIPDVRADRPDVPAPLAEVVRRALAKDPAGRFGDAAQMRGALATSLSGTRVQAVPAAAGVTQQASDGTIPGEIAPLATGHRPESLQHHTGRWWLAAAGLVVIGAGIWALVALAGGDGSSPPIATNDAGDADARAAAAPASTTTSAPVTTTAPTTTSAPRTTPPPTETPTTEPPGTAPPSTTVPPRQDTPTDLPSLIETIEPNPDAAGPRGQDLLRELQKVQERDGDKRRDAAEKAAERTNDWVDDGELDPELGDLTIGILDDIIDTTDDGDDEDDDDEDDDDEEEED